MSTERTKSGLAAQRDFRVRVVSALVLIAVTLVCTIAGGIWFTLLAAFLTAAMAREWIRMSDHYASLWAYIYAMGGLVAPVLLASAGKWKLALLALVAVTLAGALERAGRGKPWRAAGGLFYIGIAVLAVLYLRQGPGGLNRLAYLFAVVWTVDSAAYLMGSQLRGPKLWPAISPNKTWSGFAAGVALGTLAGGVAARLTGYDGGMALEVLSVALAVISVGGDLLASWLKRRFGVKDTGTAIPGHGGFLDRLDALLAAGMALALFHMAFPGIVV